ncbi:MAG: transporter substrate-binding domain-containing protein [Alphaproteobacteria bacterium]|nr:transporter substrate-binding domain-containing protein [Alphaproteobacteria bacterium]
MAATDADLYQQYRHVDAGAVAPMEMPTGQIRLLADSDYPPFSFQSGADTMTGIAVDVALAACAEIKMICQVVPRPFAGLLPGLERREGDVVISGLRLAPENLQLAIPTRPFYFSSARFLTRTGMPFSEPDRRSLASRRIGYVKGTSHAAFLEKYYERSALTPFNDENAMLESLRTAAIEVAFTDSLRAAFWLNGANARGCCIALGLSFVDRESFTRNMSFLVRTDQPNLREAFDYALDRIAEKGIMAKVFSRYLPENPF